MISDEAICRLRPHRQWFGAQALGFAPNAVSIAKQLLPASCRSRPWRSTRAWPRRSRRTPAGSAPSHGYTYGGHPVACAVGVKAIEIDQREDMPARVRALAPRFAAHLDRLAGHPLVGEARALA